MAKKRVTKAACAKRGGKFSKRKGHAAVCTMPKKGKSKRKGGKGKAARRATLAKACAAMTAFKRAKMAGLCGWAMK